MLLVEEEKRTILPGHLASCTQTPRGKGNYQPAGNFRSPTNKSPVGKALVRSDMLVKQVPGGSEKARRAESDP